MPESLRKFLAALLQLAGDRLVIEGPAGSVKIITDHLHQSESLVMRNLNQLRRLGLVTWMVDRNTIGRGQMITQIKFLTTEVPTPKQEATKTAAPAPKDDARTADVQPAQPKPPLAAVLVDYDNARGRAEDTGFSLSFVRLRDFCRRFGRIIFAEAFLSPRITTRPEIVTQVWQSGFEVIGCPAVAKDKDEVDVKIISRARRYAEYSAVDVVVIVSEDADLCENADLLHFILDVGKRLEFVSISANKEDLAGTDEPVAAQAQPNRAVQRFFRAIGIASNGTATPDAQTVQQIEYLKAIVAAADEATRSGGHSFRPLMDQIWRRIGSQWARFYLQADLQKAMTALVEAGVLAKLSVPGSTIYKVEPNHPFVVRMRAVGTASPQA